MSGQMVVRTPGEGERNEVVAVLSRAFWDDPLFDYLAGGELLSEYRVLPHVFRAAMTDLDSDLAELTVVDVEGSPRCFAGWLGPGAFPRTRRELFVRDLRAGALLLRLRHRRVAAALLREVDRRHPSEPHWYLALLGTDPGLGGRGLGSAALGPVLARCDAEHVPAYTETQ
jgi:hypothetical protein